MTTFHFLSDRSLIFSDADPLEISEYVSQHVDAHTLYVPSHHDKRANLRHRSCDKLEFCRVQYGADNVRVHAKSLESSYHLQMLLHGHCLWRDYAGEHYIAPGELLLFNPDDPVDLTHSSDCEKLIVKIPLTFLDRLFEENRWRLPHHGLRFENRRMTKELPGLGELLGLVCMELENENGLLTLQRHYARVIVIKLLELLNPDSRRELLGEIHPSFARVSEYIEENLRNDISIEQLASLANLSQRALYGLFERHTSTTPGQYIRQRRLARVRSALSDPGPNARNVTEIALDYGFYNLGRFSEAYRKAYGELPSHTLRGHS